MRKHFFLSFLLLWGISLLCAQEPKGVTPASNFELQTSNSTRAVVVGISDYQDAAIPDLRFAHRDAEAFAAYLQSPAGGALGDDRLKVLTNRQATAGRIAEALDALIEQVQEGDQVIIYFSGHGDVERKTVSQPGFLLCWDAPSRVYMGGGTYSLAFLQEIITTLSTQNRAKVIVITDACHAGKLAGSQIGGAQLTAASMARQYANEIKILSCQPNEYSLEGVQWGGGRGCFSYHLIDGLFGLADRNADQAVSVGELDRYLEDHVTAEAAPQSQAPMLLGNKTERVATVNAAVLADLKKFKSGALASFSPAEQRGLEDEVLAGVDSSIREMYRAFKLAVLHQRFFEPAGNCAEDYYALLSSEPKLAPLQGMMRRNYAAALQDDAQQVLNRWLKTDVMEVSKSKKTQQTGYAVYPRQLGRAAELLGPKHYMYAALQARKSFFDGHLCALSNQNPDPVTGNTAMRHFKNALQWVPDQPYVYWQMSQVFALQLQEPDSAVAYAFKATELAPQWVLPLTDLTFLFCERMNIVEQAAPLMEAAKQIDSNSVVVWTFLGVYYLRSNQFEPAEQYLLKAVNSSDADICYPCANIALGALYVITGRPEPALYYTEKALAMDSTNLMACSNLGLIYMDLGRPADAERILLYSLGLDSTEIGPYVGLSRLYIAQKRETEAEQVIRRGFAVDPNQVYLYIMLAALRSNQNKTDEAFELLETALKKGVNNNFDYIQNDPVLAGLVQERQRWNALMKKYFPDKVKD